MHDSGVSLRDFHEMCTSLQDVLTVKIWMGLQSYGRLGL